MLVPTVLSRLAPVAVRARGLTTVTRDVSAYLVVKDGGVCRVAAQAWDLETGERPVVGALRQHL
jgi:hypothetical protein